MTPITIEPNSGTKMAGVKVSKKLYLDSEYLEILFVGSHRFFSKDQKGVEFSYDVFSDWYLYEEPKPEVKCSDRKWSMEERIERIEETVTFIANLLKGVERV